MGRAVTICLLFSCIFGCSEDPRERTAAIYAARLDPAEDSNERVEKGLADPDPHVRTAALTTWVGLRGDDAVPAVRSALADEDGLVRTVAAKLAGDLLDDRLVERLSDHAISDGDPWVRRRALESLLQFPGMDLAPVVLRTLEDPDREVRLAAAKGLPRLGEAIESARLAEVLAFEPDWEVRAQAARALAGRVDEAAREALDAARSDESEYVRAAAYRALRSEISGPIPGLTGRLPAPLPDGERPLPEAPPEPASVPPPDPVSEAEADPTQDADPG